uniref:Uncharacterized protein n=1 Tax=Zooxanthella nutricula TaxID=1333877 RepID=A0A7S2QL33_9DINO
MEGVGVREADLLERYDLIIHMTTVASGMEDLYDFGPGSTNPSRYHTPEQARHADELAQAVYGKHQRLRTVHNFTDLADKMQAVCRCVTEALHVDGLAWRRERPRLQPLPFVAEEEAWLANVGVHGIQVPFAGADRFGLLRKGQFALPQRGGAGVAPVGRRQLGRHVTQ